MDNLYLAIDGGGTKTDAVLFNSTGAIINRAVGMGTNPNGMSFDEVTLHFKKLFTNLLLTNSMKKIKGCFAGLSGSDHPELTRKLADCIQEACPLPIHHLIVGNDAMNALWSGTEGASGLVMIAGTGSIVFGIKDNGASFRIGGWGYLFGDEGSGYFIGREAIRHVLMTFDYREQTTSLTMALSNYFHVPVISDIVPIVYKCSKDIIAGLVPIISREAEQGDYLAKQILFDASRELVALLQSGIERFETTPHVVLAGGIWKCRIIRETICSAVSMPLIFPSCPPVYGSIAKCVNEWEKKDEKLLRSLKRQLLGK
ncbi:N-acetylglucosamine kinase [Sporolactobacillus nakayamae]|uniref:BadF-type ATPase n=1 Tax=Sporolactobacillus nakayamae TaxID=269670 RepID=A0A1I2TEF7_9BACL|nr:BadF/BadG/BcrA/BcrD ATPase family protein [Sporolactobacillus nakayamae]SFG62519.1 BadF-type ATPase [Sporolactobacillus nakayamae]